VPRAIKKRGNLHLFSGDFLTRTPFAARLDLRKMRAA
jgi:hypothetical protein